MQRMIETHVDTTTTVDSVERVSLIYDLNKSTHSIKRNETFFRLMSGEVIQEELEISTSSTPFTLLKYHLGNLTINVLFGEFTLNANQTLSISTSYNNVGIVGKIVDSGLKANFMTGEVEGNWHLEVDSDSITLQAYSSTGSTINPRVVYYTVGDGNI